MGITAVLIVKNEEAQIRRCLDSLKLWVDEIVIVDDESADQTVAIAQNEYKAKVIVHPLQRQFGRQRNIGITASTQEWIIKIDADEVVPPLTAQKIRATLTQHNDKAGYELLLRDCFLGVPLKYVGNMYQLKIFKRVLVHYEGDIHETVRLDGQVGRIEGEVLHYPMKSVSAMIAKHNFYTDLEVTAYISKQPQLTCLAAKKNLLGKPIKAFIKHYFKHNGFKDGVPGLVWSMIHTIYPILFWLKVVECLHQKENVS